MSSASHLPCRSRYGLGSIQSRPLSQRSPVSKRTPGVQVWDVLIHDILRILTKRSTKDGRTRVTDGHASKTDLPRDTTLGRTSTVAGSGPDDPIALAHEDSPPTLMEIVTTCVRRITTDVGRHVPASRAAALPGPRDTRERTHRHLNLLPRDTGMTTIIPPKSGGIGIKDGRLLSGTRGIIHGTEKAKAETRAMSSFERGSKTIQALVHGTERPMAEIHAESSLSRGSRLTLVLAMHAVEITCYTATNVA